MKLILINKKKNKCDGMPWDLSQESNLDMPKKQGLYYYYTTAYDC